MKSHIYEPPQVKAQKAKMSRELREEAKQIVKEEAAEYKTDVMNMMTAVVMLSVNEAFNIGEKRMINLLNVLSEWLDYFRENQIDDVGFDLLIKRLKERGLYQLYQSVVIENHGERSDN